MSNLNAKETIIKIHYRQASEVLQFGSGKHRRICSIIEALEISLCLFHLLIWLPLSLSAQEKIYPQNTARIKRWWGLPVHGRLLPEIIQIFCYQKENLRVLFHCIVGQTQFEDQFIDIFFSDLSFPLYRRIEKANNLVYIDKDAFQHLPSLRYL